MYIGDKATPAIVFTMAAADWKFVELCLKLMFNPSIR